MEINTNNIIKTIFRIFALAYIIYILYIRILLIKEPRILFVKLSATEVAFLLFIILVVLLRSYKLLKIERVIGKNPSKNKVICWFNKHATTVSNKLSAIWLDFYRFIVIRSITIHNMIVALAKFLYKHQHMPFGLTIIFVFEILPKFLIIMAFLIDIFWFHQFNYFYKSLIFVLLPLIRSTLYAILQQFYEDNVDFFKEFITKTIIYDEVGLFRVEYNFVDDYEPPTFVKNTKNFMDFYYFPILRIKETVRIYNGVKLCYRVNLIFVMILILHLIGWLTILYFGIYAL